MAFARLPPALRHRSAVSHVRESIGPPKGPLSGPGVFCSHPRADKAVRAPMTRSHRNVHETIRAKRQWYTPPDPDAAQLGFRGWHSRGYLPHFDIGARSAMSASPSGPQKGPCLAPACSALILARTRLSALL